MSRYSNNREGCLEVIIVISILAVIIGGALLYKSVAPQSALRSRLGGKPVELERPENCKRVINMGKSEDTKYIVYETIDGDIVMKEFSDWGILQGQYVVKGGAITEEKKNDD